MAMIEHISKPAALALLTWRTAEMGGRSSGPPSKGVYAANCRFVIDPKQATRTLRSDNYFSILIEKRHEIDSQTWRCDIGFLVEGEIDHLLTAGTRIDIMEGPKIVGNATIIERII